MYVIHRKISKEQGTRNKEQGTLRLYDARKNFMTACWNNKGRITFRIVFIIFCSMLYALCYLLYPEIAISGPYLGTPPNFDDSSAHGNPNYGVKRSAIGFPTDYTRGLCAHCHEQHRSIGGAEPQPVDGHPSIYLLLSDFVGQFNVPCFDCHTETNQLQDPTEPMNQQYSYSYIAGGDTNTCPANINRAFAFITSDCTLSRANNCGSSLGSAHCLKDIAISLKNIWGFESVASGNDPCSGCHNPHRAQRDPHTITGRIVDGKLVSSVSRPSQHTDLTTWELWGDDVTERMNRYNYQPPYRYNSTSTFEPDGYNISDATRTVDYVTFCLDCHQYAINGTAHTVAAINWGGNGDIHGAAPPQTCCDKGDKKAPYTDGINYVLSCLDCHEPHGSPNEFLLRQEVNGAQVPNFDMHFYYNLCISCHTNLNTKHIGFIPVPTAGTDCWGCHRHGVDNYPKPLGCESCPGSYVKTF